MHYNEGKQVHFTVELMETCDMMAVRNRSPPESLKAKFVPNCALPHPKGLHQKDSLENMKVQL